MILDNSYQDDSGQREWTRSLTLVSKELENCTDGTRLDNLDNNVRKGRGRGSL